MSKTGKLYGIGIGPGDPELITLKALRLLRAAAVVVFPAPEQGESLAKRITTPHLPGGQIEYFMRMPLVTERFPAQSVYDQAASDIAQHLEAGRDVAVLCEGDPFLYGSFMYLYGRLQPRFEAEVVPGITSLTACAAAAGAPLVARNDILAVIPAPLPDEDIAFRLAAVDAAALVKVGRHFFRVRALLKQLNLAHCATYVQHATWPTQKVLKLDAVDPMAVPYFAMILIHKRGDAWRTLEAK